MKRENFYRRNPGDALSGMVGMTLEERGVYNTIIDLIYLTWRPLEDSRAYIAGHCGCAVQKLNPILDRLIQRGKILRFQEGGVWYLSNRRFEDERAEVKGATKTRSGRGGVGEKSGEGGEKSPGVGENSPLLKRQTKEIPTLKPLERQERVEVEAKASTSSRSSAKRRDYPTDFEVAWAAYPHHPGRSSKPDALTEWRRLPDEERATLVGAITRFRPNVESACGGKGAPCMSRWLKHGKHLNWTNQAQDAGLQLALAEQAPDPWPRRIREYQRNAYWNRLEWGPPPGKPGCTLSPELLMAQGYTPTTTGAAA